MTGRSAERGPARRHAAARTCVGCRRRDDRSALLRVVAVEDGPGAQVRVEPDPRRRRPGRGAWLHPVDRCLVAARDRRAFTRALRLQSAPDLTGLVDWVAQQDGSTTAPANRVGADGRRRV